LQLSPPLAQCPVAARSDGQSLTFGISEWIGN
jgi:hypothetical protein